MKWLTTKYIEFKTQKQVMRREACENMFSTENTEMKELNTYLLRSTLPFYGNRNRNSELRIDFSCFSLL